MTTGASMGGSFSSDPAARESLDLLASLLFAEPGRVVELRALKVDGVRGSGTASGYFDDPAKFVDAALSLDGRAQGVYATLNEVKPELLARANNRIIYGPEKTTANQDVVRRRWLLIDADPRRASGISSSEEELREALRTAEAVADYLTTIGFPEPGWGLSGNGGHLLYAVNLPADDGGLITEFLKAIAFYFDSASVQIDTSVASAGQITKAYGTLARKGDPLPDRPHRRSKLFLPERGLKVVDESLLRSVAALLPKVQQPRAQSAPSTPGATINVDDLLARAGIEVVRTGPWQGGTRWVLKTCPFNADHTNLSAFVLQFASGALAAGCHHNSCQGNEWPQFRRILEPYWPSSGVSVGSAVPGGPPQFRIGSAPFVSVGSASQGGFTANPWPEPAELAEELLPVMAFDAAMLPNSLRGWIEDITERIQCPPDFVAAAAMVALAGSVGRRVGIRPKQRDDWIVVPNLWGAVIGRPGILKSPAIQEAINPLKRLEVDAKKRFDESVKAFEAKAIINDAKKDAAKKKVRDAARDGADLTAIAESLLSTIEDDGPEPIRERFLINDSTVEKLGELLNENPMGLTCYRDELIGLLKSLDKEGQEGARAFYLEAWNGSGRYTYDRIARGTIDIEAATVSIIGGIQPGPLRGYLNDAVTSGKQDDGLLQRFQVTVWPDVGGAWKLIDRYPNSAKRNQAYAVYFRLATLDANECGAERDEFDPDGIPFLRFTPAAQNEFNAWLGTLETHLRANEEHPAIDSHFAKYRSLVPSLALLIHLADGERGAVGVGPLRQALLWAQYLATHARRLYALAINPDVFAAKALARKLLDRSLVGRFTARDVYRKGWTHLPNKDAVMRAVGVLIEHDWLRESVDRSSGAQKTVFEINPRIFELKVDPAHDCDADTGNHHAGAAASQSGPTSLDAADKTDSAMGTTAGVSVGSGESGAPTSVEAIAVAPENAPEPPDATDIADTDGAEAIGGSDVSSSGGLFPQNEQPLTWEDLG